MFPDEKAAEDWFESERWGLVGMFCPRCGGCDRVYRVSQAHALLVRRLQKAF